jgi:hypothetical protein
MPNRLLDRQVRLLEYLRSTAAIFGDQADMPADPALQGIDRRLLRLEARSSCNRRIEKVLAVFPRTFDIFGSDRKPILREFVEVSQPTTMNSLANARQFSEFLLARWQLKPPTPAYLPDVAACELAMAEVCNKADEMSPTTGNSRDGAKRSIRRRRSVVPRRCDYDIRSIFEAGLGGLDPPKRETPLVVTLPAGFCDAKIFEVSPVVFDLITLLDDWVDPTTLATINDLENLLSHLSAHELIEVET